MGKYGKYTLYRFWDVLHYVISLHRQKKIAIIQLMLNNRCLIYHNKNGGGYQT